MDIERSGCSQDGSISALEIWEIAEGLDLSTDAEVEFLHHRISHLGVLEQKTAKEMER